MKLSEIKARAEAATPGPWTFKPEGFYFDMEHSWTVVAPDGETRICMEPTDFSAYPSGSFISPDGVAANGAFIAAAREDVPALIATVEALASDNARLEKALDGLRSSAIILSDDYLSIFASWHDRRELQGWPKERWVALSKAAKNADAALAGRPTLPVEVDGE